MVEKFYDNRNFKILKINKKTENISMLIIVLCTLLLLVFFLKIKRFYINDIGLFFSAFGAVLISVFPFSIVHEYIHLLSYPKKSRKKIIFKMKNLQPIISVESDAKMSKCRTLIMLISPTLVLAIIPIFLSFIIKKLILMTFLIFFGFFSWAGLLMGWAVREQMVRFLSFRFFLSHWLLGQVNGPSFFPLSFGSSLMKRPTQIGSVCILLTSISLLCALNAHYFIKSLFLGKIKNPNKVQK